MKLFVTDLDGTLLNSAHKLSDFSLQALNKAMAEGVPLCIATGRSYHDILDILKDLKEMPYIISSNGASVYDKDGNKMYSVAIEKDQIRAIITYLQGQKLQFEVADDEYSYTTKEALANLKQELEDVGTVDTHKQKDLENNTLGLVLSQKNLKVVEDIDTLLSMIEETNNISSMSAYLNKIQKAMEYFTMDKRLRTFSSWKYNFEMTSRETSKGIALKSLCAHLEISLQDVAAIGDNYNDLSMLKVAGMPAAMANAVDHVKSIASYQAKSNDEDGAVRYLYHLLGKPL